MAMSSGLSTGCTAKISPWRQNGSIARNITVCPPISRYCFGPPAPARRPRPAATRMAAVRSELAMGFNYDGLNYEQDGERPRHLAGRPYHAPRIKKRAIPLRCEERHILLHCTCKTV